MKQLFTWHLHCVRDSITSYSEMMWSIWVAVHRFYANATPFYIKDFSPGTNPPHTPDTKGQVYFFFCLNNPFWAIFQLFSCLSLSLFFNLPPALPLEVKHSCSSVFIVSRESFVKQKWEGMRPKPKPLQSDRTLGYSLIISRNESRGLWKVIVSTGDWNITQDGWGK